MTAISAEELRALPDKAFEDEWVDLSKQERDALDETGEFRERASDIIRAKALESVVQRKSRPTSIRTTTHSDERISIIAPLDWRTLVGKEPPPREWHLPHWVPKKIPTLLAGPPGSGKSLMAQQIGSIGALARMFIEQPPASFKTLAWFCEDEPDELWRRQLDIARWLDVPLDVFADKFFAISRFGEDNVLASTEYGKLMFTPRLAELVEQANDLGVDLVILDNVAQIYGGNENDRPMVTLFMNTLMGALRGKSLLPLAHPARSSGSEFAGSGAWEAVVRSRLYLGTHLPGEDEEIDTNVRILARRKANYASMREIRRFAYTNGVLVPADPQPMGGVVAQLYRERAERAVLAAAERLASMDVIFTNAANSPDYMPKVIAAYRLSEGVPPKEIAAAMRKLMMDGRLVRAVVGQYANRAPRQGLKLVPERTK